MSSSEPGVCVQKRTHLVFFFFQTSPSLPPNSVSFLFWPMDRTDEPRPLDWTLSWALLWASSWDVPWELSWGLLEGIYTGKINPCGRSPGSTRGSNFAFACSVRRSSSETVLSCARNPPERSSCEISAKNAAKFWRNFSQIFVLQFPGKMAAKNFTKNR